MRIKVILKSIIPTLSIDNCIQGLQRNTLQGCNHQEVTANWQREALQHVTSSLWTDFTLRSSTFIFYLSMLFAYYGQMCAAMRRKIWEACLKRWSFWLLPWKNNHDNFSSKSWGSLVGNIFNSLKFISWAQTGILIILLRMIFCISRTMFMQQQRASGCQSR